MTQIVTSSKWKEELKHTLIVQGSKTLMIILPGYGYGPDAPLLYYMTNLGIEEYCDVLCIEYGYMKAQAKVNIKDEMGALVKETQEALEKALQNDYRNVIFVGKSLGTFLINELKCMDSSKYESYIYLTPHDESVPITCNNNTLLIFGTKDKLICGNTIGKIKKRKDLEFLEVLNADHSLEGEDTAESIKVLSTVMEKCKDFINKHKAK